MHICQICKKPSNGHRFLTLQTGCKANIRPRGYIQRWEAVHSHLPHNTGMWRGAIWGFRWGGGWGKGRYDGAGTHSHREWPQARVLQESFTAKGASCSMQRVWERLTGKHYGWIIMNTRALTGHNSTKIHKLLFITEMRRQKVSLTEWTIGRRRLESSV